MLTCSPRPGNKGLEASLTLHAGRDQIFFGATVTYLEDGETEREVTILGIDEADSAQGQISWISPVARALLKARVGDEVQLPTPGGLRTLEIVAVRYPSKEGRPGAEVY